MCDIPWNETKPVKYCYICTIAIYGYAWNVHRVFITYIHRTWESRYTKNTYDFLVQVRNFLLPLSLKVLRHKEGDIHSFYSGFSICSPSRAAPVARKFVWPLRPPKVDPSHSVSSSQPLTFSNLPKSPAHASGAWRHSHPLSGIFNLTSVNDTSSQRTRQHLRSSLHLTNPCAEPKGSQPNKTQRRDI